MKRLGKLLLRTFKQKDNKARTIRLHGEWVDVDPSMWNEDMDVKIKTGLGIGAAAEQIQFLMATIQLQKEAILSGASFMVTPKDLYRAVTELNKAMGFRGDEVFFTDPGENGWPAPDPDFKILENERRVEDDRAKNMLKRMEIETSNKEADAIIDFREKELAQKKELAQEEMSLRKEIAEMQTREGNDDGESDDE